MDRYVRHVLHQVERLEGPKEVVELLDLLLPFRVVREPTNPNILFGLSGTTVLTTPGIPMIVNPLSSPLFPALAGSSGVYAICFRDCPLS